MQPEPTGSLPRTPKRHQFSLRALFVAVVLISVVLKIIMWGVRSNQVPFGILGACLSVLAFCGWYVGLHDSPPKSFRYVFVAVSAIAGAWLLLALVFCLWLIGRDSQLLGAVTVLLQICLWMFEFVSALISWGGFFSALGLLLRRDCRRHGLAMIGVSLAFGATTVAFWRIIGIR